MRLTVVEPGYFPAISVCAKMLCADQVIWADSFACKKHSTINRTRIKTITGPAWLTLPVLSKGLRQLPIARVKLDKHTGWLNDHLRSLESNYHNSPYYYYYIDDLQALLSQEYVNLHDAIWNSAAFCFAKIRSSPPMMSHELPVVPDRTHRILAYLEAASCDSYLLLPHEEKLIDIGRLQSEGVKLYRFGFVMEPYHQQFEGFAPDLSILDLLFNEGPAARELLLAMGRVGV